MKLSTQKFSFSEYGGIINYEINSGTGIYIFALDGDFV